LDAKDMITKKRNKILLGKFKLLYGRTMSYVGIISFLMLLKVFAMNEPLGLNWVIWLIIVFLICVGVTIFDVLFVIEGDANYGFSKTPKFVEMDKDIKEIKEQNKVILKLLEDRK
jgi:hypothetical protein